MDLIFVRYDFRPKAVLMHIHCCLTVKTAETLAAKDADFVIFNLDRRFLLVEPLCGLRVDLPYMKRPAYAVVRTSFTSSDSVVNIAL